MRLPRLTYPLLIIALACQASSSTASQPSPICALPPADLLEPGWPVEDTTADHHLGSTFEYNDNTGTKRFHPGIDILAPPFLTADGTLDCEAPYVVVTVTGEIRKDHPELIANDPNHAGEDIAFLIKGDVQGRTYQYGHLAADTLTVEFANTYNNGDPVDAGRRIARIWLWDKGCPGFDHLHYTISEPDGSYTAPMQQLREWSWDTEAPEIGPIVFYADDADVCAYDQTWPALGTTNPGGCPIVAGDVDVVVGVSDHHRAEAAARKGDVLAPRALGYHLRAEDGTQQSSPYHDFATLPSAWINDTGTPNPSCVYFSIQQPSETTTHPDHCEAEQYYVTPTHVVGQDLTDAAAAWSTGALSDGFYSLTVWAEDDVQNESSVTIPVCVDNNSACEGKLLLRDCDLDEGGEPSPCPLWWSSPDIITWGAPRVCMTNVGCRSIPAQQSVKLSLEMTYPSGYLWPWIIPSKWDLSFSKNPVLLASQLRSRAGATLAGDWSVGQERCFSAGALSPSMQPLPGDLLAHARVSTGNDVFHPTSSFRDDNNKAARQIPTIRRLPPVLFFQRKSFFFVPDDGFGSRRIEIEFDVLGRRPARIAAGAEAGPGLEAGRIAGGAMSGTFPESERARRYAAVPSGRDPARFSPSCPSRSADPFRLTRSRCWQVVGGAAVDGRLVLEDVDAVEPVPIVLFLRREDAFDDLLRRVRVTIREYGVRGGRGQEIELGRFSMDVDLAPAPD